MTTIIVCFILTTVISYNYGKVQGMREIMDEIIRELETEEVQNDG